MVLPVAWSSRRQPVSCLLFLVMQFVFYQGGTGLLKLRVAYITTNEGQYVSNGSIPAVTLAVDEVNREFSDQYHLQIQRSSISCDRTDSLDAYFKTVQSEGSPLIALLGCGCSPATEPVAEISHYENIIHISYVSSSPILSDRSRFQLFWRTYPSDNNLALAVLAVLRQYDWNQLKIITQEETLFVEASQTLTAELIKNEVIVDQTGALMVSSTETFLNTSADMLFSPEIRVFFLNMYEEQARRVLCQAVKLNEVPAPNHHVPGYVWLIHGWYKQFWWTAEVANDDVVNCTNKELEGLLRNSIAILQIPTSQNFTAPTDVALTAEQFTALYEMKLGDNPTEPSAPLAYDAVWTLALALNQTGVNNDSYTNTTNLAEDIKTVLSSNFAFLGVSGKVDFDENGTRQPQDTAILQYRSDPCSSAAPVNSTDLKMVQVATLAEENDNFTYNCERQGCASLCETNDTVWPDGVPSDGTPSRVLTTIKMPIFIIYSILASAGIVFVVVCLIFNVVFRERKIVKLTSPNLNYVVLLGAFFLYASIYFYVLPSTEKFTSTLYCHIRAWLQPTGYFISFGTIMFKMWRVYFIFHNPSAKKKRKIPKDWMLFLGVLGLFGVFVIIMVAVTIFDEYKATEVEDKETRVERDENKVLVEHYNLVCEGKKSIVWIAVVIVYALAMQIVAVYLAFRTRKVKIKALNDAKYLAFIIYSSTVILTGMIIGTVSLRDFLNIDAVVFCTGLLFFTTSILGLLFVPKMVILYKDPRGEFIFNRSMSQVQGTITSLNDAERDKLRDLEVYCRDIESRLGKYETVQPYRSLSQTKLVSSSTDLTNSLRLTSISKPPLNHLGTTSPSNAQQPSTSNGYSSTGDIGDAEGAVKEASPTPSKTPAEHGNGT